MKRKERKRGKEMEDAGRWSEKEKAGKERTKKTSAGTVESDRKKEIERERQRERDWLCCEGRDIPHCSFTPDLM